jgi:hypothetical protein
MTDLSEMHEAGGLVVESNTLALLNRSEIESQIATARRYPRSLANFRKDALAMVTLSTETAESCIYALPRADKTLEGPSVRFAEIIQSAWGNCRSGARVVNEQDTYLTAQGAFLDLEHNAGVTYDVQRRIVDSKGYRYSVDMVGVTANAACSIAHRNAILKGVPKALWNPVYLAARASVMGDFKTLGNRRAEAIKKFQAFGVTKEMIFELLGVSGVQDIVVEHLVTLHGVLTAIQEGDTTVEQMFAPKDRTPSTTGSATPSKKPKGTATDLNTALDGQSDGKSSTADSTPQPGTSQTDGEPKSNTATPDKSETTTAKPDPTGAAKPDVPKASGESPQFTEARLIEAADTATSVARLDELDAAARQVLTGEALQRILQNNALCRAEIQSRGNPLPQHGGKAPPGLFED